MHLVLFLLACTDPQSGAPASVPDREPGVRAPVTRTCDEQDPARCLLPWPSSAFMTADPSTATGLRLAVSAEALPVADDPRMLNRADGFSRLSPVATVFEGELGLEGLAPFPAWSTDAALRIYNAEPGHPQYGQPVPLWTDLYVGGGEASPDSFVIGYPRQPLAASAEHVVVITDGIRRLDGSVPEQSWETRIILGLEAPSTDQEAAVQAYHAPTRALLEQVGIDPESVLRVFDFTTRSVEDPTRRLASMIAQVSAGRGALQVELDALGTSSNPDIAGIVRGRVLGVPDFLDPDGNLVLGSDGLPQVTGSTEAPFRILVPSGEGPYHVALYGHGTGGDVTDGSFDDEMAAFGIAKAGTEFIGWNGQDLVYLFASLTAFQSGIETSTSGLMQSVANTQAILQVLDGGPLALALSADTLLGQDNPMKGRLPDVAEPMWMGGSLGGAMGSVISSAFPQVHYSVCNVPNGAWSHTIPRSLLYDTALLGVLSNVYGDEIDVIHQFAISQTGWDDIDGAAWADAALAKDTMFLFQESIDDPIVPNGGTDILAVAVGATLVGPVLQDIPGLARADEISAGAALTQFRVPDTGQYDVHGFAAMDTPAGDAAFEQIVEFALSVWVDGAPRISFPEGCSEVTPNGDCDFSGMWSE